MTKRLIHFRNTNDFARVETRKAKANPKQGNGVQWASCNKAITKPKGIMRFGFTSSTGHASPTASFLGGVAGGIIGRVTGGLPGSALGALAGTQMKMDIFSPSVTISGTWNPENALPPKFFKGNFELFTRPCDDIMIGAGKF
jgi:hypothetical protein